MRAYPFIFSDQPGNRLARHFTLWMVYAVYFTLQSYYPTGSTKVVDLHFVKLALLSTCMFMPFCLLSAYLLLYFLYPRYLRKSRFGMFLVNFLLLILAGAIINYWGSTVFLEYNSFGGPATFPQKLSLGLHNVAIGIIISVFLLGVKLGKDAYIQQKVNLELARIKARTELQLLKTRIDPQFLFRSLDKLRAGIRSGSPDSPSSILELSDILSYILYECDEELVPLEKETDAVMAFIAMERIGTVNTVPLSSRITGSTAGKFITPLALLSLLQNGFGSLYTNPQNLKSIDFDMVIAENNKLIFSIFIERTPPILHLPDTGLNMHAIRNRLDALCPGSYTLNGTREGNRLILRLEILLQDAIETEVYATLTSTKPIPHESI